MTTKYPVDSTVCKSCRWIGGGHKADCNRRLTAAVDALIDARNVAYEAQQRYSDTTAGVGAESLGRLGRITQQEVSDALYEATYELVNRIDNLIGRAEFQNLT